MAKKNTPPTRKAIYLGTPELQNRYTIVPKLRNLWEYHAKVIDGCELDSMLIEGKINHSQHNTLERFSAILHRAGYAKIGSVDLSNASVKLDPSYVADKKSKAMMRIVKMMNYIEKEAGRVPRLSVINMIVTDTPIQDIKHLHKVVNALENYFSR